MFRPEAMCKLRLLMLASEVQDAALLLARLGSFSPAALSPAEMCEWTSSDYREAWLEANSRLDKLLEFFPDLAPPRLPPEAVAPSLADLQELNAWLKASWLDCSQAREATLLAEQEQRRLDAVETTLQRLARLDTDLAALLDPDSLLNVRIGSLPGASVARMREALSICGHILVNFDHDAGQIYAVIAGPRQRADEARGLLAQAGWRALDIPAELRSDAEAARTWLDAQRARADAAIKAQHELLERFRAQALERLLEARVRLALARPLAEAALTGVRGQGALVALAGWVPRRRLEELRVELASRFHGACWLSVETPTAAEAASVPSLVRYPRWLQPFVPLVRGYGVPRYGEFDPTLPFMLIYLLLFGAMFGDLGHGAVILLISLLAWRRLGKLAVVGMAAGGVSMLFGLLYGSVFGVEHLLPALWLSPMQEPMRVLQLALALGVVFIALTLLANVFNNFAARRIGQALFASGGLAGLLFYLGLVGVAASLLGRSQLGGAAGLMALLALLCMAAYTWFETHAGLGERALVTLIESVETGTSLFANTLSFMRVAAFSLNHAALALAVFTLAEGLGQTGHGLALVLGNLVIIVLEGGIVAIQALRLMYYEGFSRFFSADGNEFVPLRLSEP